MALLIPPYSLEPVTTHPRYCNHINLFKAPHPSTPQSLLDLEIKGQNSLAFWGSPRWKLICSYGIPQYCSPSYPWMCQTGDVTSTWLTFFTLLSLLIILPLPTTPFPKIQLTNILLDNNSIVLFIIWIQWQIVATDVLCNTIPASCLVGKHTCFALRSCLCLIDSWFHLLHPELFRVIENVESRK